LKLTANFKALEFACKDGTPVPQTYLGNLKALALCLERVREKFDRPVRVISGYRTLAYNDRCGGSKPKKNADGSIVTGTGSKHLFAMAADIQIKGVEPAKVAEAIEELIEAGKIPEGGLGVYKTFCHYDHRLKKARWVG